MIVLIFYETVSTDIEDDQYYWRYDVQQANDRFEISSIQKYIEFITVQCTTRID